MKKAAIFVLVLLLSFMLWGCGSENENPPAPSETVEEQAPVISEEAENPEAQETEIPEAPAETLSFEAQTLMDNEFCTVKITGIDPDNMFGYTLNATIENKSADKILNFSISDSSVNGVKLDPGFFEDLEPSGTKEINIIFRNKDNLDYIGEFTDIKMSLIVAEKDCYPDILASETVHIYPCGEDKAVNHVHEIKDGEFTILDNDKLSVSVIGYSSDNAFGLKVELYVVNKLDNAIVLMAEDEKVNGMELRPYFTSPVPGNCCSYEKIQWPRSLFDENNISHVDSVEFRLQACNFKNLFDEYADEPVLLKPDFTS